MKNFYQILALLITSTLGFSQVQEATLTLTPEKFNEDESVTLTFGGIDASAWGATDLYLWAWYYKNGSTTAQNDSPNNGTWNNSSESQKLTDNGDGNFSITLTPNTFFNDTNITRVGVLVKPKDGGGSGSPDKKTDDVFFDVGRVGVAVSSHNSFPIVVAPNTNTAVRVNLRSGGSFKPGSFVVYFNETQIASGSGFTTYTFQLNVSEDGILRIVGTDSISNPTNESGEVSVEVVVAQTTQEVNMPVGLEEGINYHASDHTKATLVLSAPSKNFVSVAGSFNNYDPDETYVMKKDPSSGKFWLELSGLTSNEIYTYQYWVYDVDPVEDSPQIVKTADPYSTLVLSPFDDDYIPETTYPNVPTYPVGQSREVTVLQTGQSDYNWQVPNFNKPAKEDLVIYEVLIRDFDQNRSFQDLIDRVSYFKNLNINAIQLMPIMEFEGNESWGYNTAFHLALDKFYGTPTKFKELVDTFHQNGIAVILDLALNHAFGRAPGIRMWMDDPDGNGWGDPSTENPYFNAEAKHSYSVGSDFNHESDLTKYFTKRVIKHWIEEYKIDGFRWDLTKGFTQNCGPSDDGCTNNYQADRVAVLKEYADYSWSIDPNHYVIFEHLGGDNEEREWANYRLSEGKGIMMWGKMTNSYNQLSMGFGTEDASIERMRSESREFNGKRLVGYAESHDEERLMYRNLQYGNSSSSNHNIKSLNTALSRMSAIGAVSLLVPGPKMIWHFGELGMQQSLNTCPDGTLGDCRLDTKPQLQWDENWLNIAQRKQIYDDWSMINSLKRNNEVFRANSAISPYNNNNLIQRIYVWDDNLSDTSLKNVVILANFDVNTQSIPAGFPYIGTWYDLMDNSTFEVNNTNQGVSLQAGEFKIFGNKQAALSQSTLNLIQGMQLIQNPVNDQIQIQTPSALSGNIDWKIYNTAGVEVAYGSTTVQQQTLQIPSPKKLGNYFVVLRHTYTNTWGLLKVLRQ
jgi:1,4-alpha-glucan branching enzyme